VKLKVIAAHVSSYPNPISFEPGQEIQVGRRDTQYDGWVWVTTNDGNEGWAPEQYIDHSVSPAMAINRYSARELDTSVGELLDSTKTLNQWAWVTNSSGGSGWIPVNTTVRV
jgi:hypothetical protein